MTEEQKIPPEIAKMSFEEALTALEHLVRQLETGKVKLDDAVDAYAQGTLLRRHCEQKLALAKIRIDQISASANGQINGTTSLTLE